MEQGRRACFSVPRRPAANGFCAGRDKGANARFYKVMTADGRMAGTVSRLLNLPDPPAKFVVDVEGQKLAVELREGQQHMIAVN